MKKLRVKHGFFTKVVKLKNARNIKVVFAEIDEESLITYLQKQDSGKVLEYVVDFLYKDNFQLPEGETITKLIELLKTLKFEEKYQYQYRNSLINELRLRLKK